MSIDDGLKRTQPVLDRVNDAIRGNPLAASFIGAGIVWMLFGTKGLGIMGSLAKDAGSKVTAASVGAGSAAFGVGSAASSAVKSAASDAIESVASIVPDLSAVETAGPTTAATDTGRALNNRLQAMAMSGREYTAAVQSRLSESFQQQPLLLGAIGLAIGAGIASTFSTTAVESGWMGEQGAAARETLQNAADEAKDRAQRVISDLASEAERQGLTLDAARDAVNSISGKIGNIAETAKEAVSQSSPSGIPAGRQ